MLLPKIILERLSFSLFNLTKLRFVIIGSDADFLFADKEK
jgi:hypothetical protein